MKAGHLGRPGPFGLPDFAKLTQYELVLYGVESGEKLSFSFEYRKQLFERETIVRIVTYFTELIQSVLENKDILLRDIRISYDLGTAELDLPRANFAF